MEQPSEAIREEYGSDYVVSDLKHNSFLSEAEADPNLVEVYRDNDAVVFQVLSVESAD